METFYNGFVLSTRLMFDAGSLLSKYFEKWVELIETIIENSYQWSTARVNTTNKVTVVNELGESTTLLAQIAALTNLLNNVVATLPPIAATPVTVVPSMCTLWGTT